MAANIQELHHIIELAAPYQARLVAVSKTKPAEDILTLYQAGHKWFGENYVQELVQKQAFLPHDIAWHFIGHLQRNKVKYIAPFISMIQSVDNAKLLKEIGKQALKNDRMIDCLLQVHIAKEETKFGLNEEELIALLKEVNAHFESYQNVRLCGLMGMATNTKDESIIHEEFHFLKELSDKVRTKYISYPEYFKELSMGMSNDYTVALEEGSTLLRVGSLLFGRRE